MKILEIAFGGKAKRTSGKITDRIKTFEDACKELGIDASGKATVSTTESELSDDLKSIAAYTQLIIIVRALNEGWKPNWEDGNEKKWFPWFVYKSGFGFSYTDYDHWDTNTHVGSRLCFKTEELAKYAATQFESIYNDYLNL